MSSFIFDNHSGASKLNLLIVFILLPSYIMKTIWCHKILYKPNSHHPDILTNRVLCEWQSICFLRKDIQVLEDKILRKIFKI